MKINPAALESREAYRLFVTVVAPRPIAWVSTADETGTNNLAPFSMYTLLSAVPAVIGFGVGSFRDGKKKDTLRNVEANREFVINIVTEDVAEAMNITSAPFPPEVSEFERASLTPVKSEMVLPPRVGEAAVSLECRAMHILRFGQEPLQNSFVIGEVLLAHVKDGLWRQDGIDGSRLKVVGRLGGGTDLYCRTRDTFEMKRPQTAL
jgi:flavin reductase (DIM6/NTAB) family NADH-FMN oxidoreductase RutF